ncbi:MAG: HD domain-containing protein [Deferrisomatales bacterium]|nr:HD domain-containing protein [Deferrisomatales bacterium]
MFQGIRFKLTTLTFLLVATITTASSVVAMNVMDEFILGQLVRRGLAIGRSVSSAAAYSFLAGDRLALDNLVSKVSEQQDDIVFVAVVDQGGRLRAHSDLRRTNEALGEAQGRLLEADPDGSRVLRVLRDEGPAFDFRVPVSFAGKHLGQVHLEIANDALVTAQSRARTKVFLVSALVLALGVTGTLLISRLVTTPIKVLARCVSELSTGQYKEEIPVRARDELGELSRSFNEMARLITKQQGSLQQYARDLEGAYVGTVKVLAAAIEARDPYTLGHSERVATLSVAIGRVLGLDEAELRDLELACLFHDVGKIRTPDQVLQKLAPLNEEERRVIMRHPEDGADVLRIVESLHGLIPGVLHHHEWYDGSGYPEGLSGDQIPLFAAIIAIADAYDAMTSSRSYREALSPEQAAAELLAYRGTQFHPQLTDLVLEILERDGILAGEEPLACRA